MDSAGAFAALIFSVAVLIGTVGGLFKMYLKNPEDVRLGEAKKDLEASQKEVEYLEKKNRELESNLANASSILIEFTKLKEQVSQLQKEVEDLRPRVMEYENLSKKYAELQTAYDKLKDKNDKLEVQVKSYEEILIKAVAQSKDALDGTSNDKNTDPSGQGCADS